MGKLLAYSMVSGLIMLAVYLVYKLVIARENQHGFNRGLLLGIYLVSFSAYPVYTFIDNTSVESTVVHSTTNLAEVENLAFEPVVQPIGQASEQASEQAPDQPLWGTILIWIFLFGASAVAIKTIITWIRIVRVIRSGVKINQQGVTLVVVDNDKMAPFSWMRYVVITRGDLDNPAIIAHELKHIRSLHWIDLLIAQIVCIVNWFNPAAWLMRDELMLVHEYQADMAVVSGGHNPQEYQMLLIKKAVGSRFPSLANSINHSKLKKRITMMYKSKSGAGSKLKALALVPMVALALGVASVPAVKAAVSTISNSEVSLDKGSKNLPDGKIGANNSPQNNNGGQVATPNELYEFYPDLWVEILNNVKFPKSLENEKIDVKAVVQFTINADGYLTDAKILKSSGYELVDTEILRVVNSVKKKFTPKEKDGKAISVTYTMPFTFKTKGLASQSPVSDSKYVEMTEVTTMKKDASKLNVKNSLSNSKTIKISNEDNALSIMKDAEIYIDGKKVSEEEMKALAPETIASMSIDKQNNKITITSK